MPSLRISVILVALGSFLLGVTWGILIYDSYWGLNEILYKPSISLNVNSTYGAPFYALIGAIGAVLLIVSLRNILWRKP